MRKLTILICAILLVPIVAIESRADYKDLQERVDTVLEVWVGGYANEDDSSTLDSEAARQGLTEEATRQPTNKAGEYYALDDSISGGFLYKDAHMPSRLHLEADFYNEDDWYGDFRYSYKDYLQIRFLPRRLYHRLDNIRLYAFPPFGATIDINANDLLTDDYGLTVDIDRAKIRFKTPNFPMHIFGDAEYILKKGKKQQRFLGGHTYHYVDTRASEAREVDQEKREYTAGINSHLGPVEVEYTWTNRQFESDVHPDKYSYERGSFNAPFLADEFHNLTPELEANIHNIKAHTSHTGRIFASATATLLKKENNDTNAEAENTMYYGELFWLPATYVSVSTKFRHQKNESDTSDVPTVLGSRILGGFGSWNFDSGGGPGSSIENYNVYPAVESKTNSGSVEMRVSMLPNTNLSFKFAKKEKKVEDQSALQWSRPSKAITDIYELGLTNWALPKVRITGKLRFTNNVWESDSPDYVNNDPSDIDELTLGLTWTISPKVLALVNTHFAHDQTNNNRNLHIPEPLDGEALRQNHVASISFMISDKLTISPTYTFMSFEQDRDIVWEDGSGAHYIDTGYSNEQLAHNISLGLQYLPTKQLDINAAVDYTITDCHYEPTMTDLGGTTFYTGMIGDVSATDTKELTVRLDTDFDVGHGWGVGMNLRYTDWEDTSFDQPSEGDYVGGLLKLSKKMLF